MPTIPPATPSPDVESFSTPPMTPTVAESAEAEIRPSLSRRSSRPSNLHLTAWSADDIVVDQLDQQGPKSSPGPVVAVNTNVPAAIAHDASATARVAQPGSSHYPQPGAHSSMKPNDFSQALSPYFVHSQLQGPSFKEYLEERKNKAMQEARIARSGPHGPHADGTVSEPYSDVDDESEYGGSITAQLAETAVGVREMSKQLGRTRLHSNIQNVLIVTKARDNRLIKLTRELALYLMLKRRPGTGRGMTVYVDAQLKTSKRFDAAAIERDHPELFVPFPHRRTSSSSSLSSGVNGHDGHLDGEGQLRYWTADMCSRSPHLFDFVVTLGGDGTVLFTSWLFQRIVPPVLSFALGSLGFLTNFDFADHQQVMDTALDGGIRVNLRMRFTCTVYRAVQAEPGKWKRRAVRKADTGEIMMKNIERGGWEALEGGPHDGKYGCSKDKEIKCFTTRPVECFEVLNDLVVDRGPSPYVSQLELFGDEHHLTTVQADGLTISTPTGSTAYSMSAGGSLVHPEIPAILMTPICPHTLSFRPMLLPDSMEVRICVPFNSRSTAWASFDGRGRVELKQGDHIKVTASKYPFPTVCADTQSVDWFNAISRTLKWNERERQKSFVVVEESPTRGSRKKRNVIAASHPGGDAHSDAVAHANGTPEKVNGDTNPEGDEDDEDEEDEEDEEEEKFDIDDLSSTESSPPNTSKERVLAELTKATPEEKAVARAKVMENESAAHPDEHGHEHGHEHEHEPAQTQAQAEIAARVLSAGNPYMKWSPRRSRSRSRTGLQTPDRFAGPHPHPPRLSPRHVQFASSASSSSSLVSQAQPEEHVPQRPVQSRSRTPRSAREHEMDSVKTPTLGGAPWGRRGGSRSRSGERAHGPQSRAFAVWGQDESDSATSDSDGDV